MRSLVNMMILPGATKTLINKCLTGFFLLTLLACSPEPETGPGEVRWDRETCTRCNMAIGDRHYAAQIRGAASAEKTRLYKFDDIGCAITWLEQQDWKDDPRTEIWVADYRDAEWLDARKASYVTGKISPMNYGLGAQAEITAGALDFSQAKAHIMASETEHHQHGGHNSMTHENNPE
jgi:copper chaperone NosL